MAASLLGLGLFLAGARGQGPVPPPPEWKDPPPRAATVETTLHLTKPAASAVPPPPTMVISSPASPMPPAAEPTVQFSLTKPPAPSSVPVPPPPPVPPAPEAKVEFSLTKPAEAPKLFAPAPPSKAIPQAAPASRTVLKDLPPPAPPIMPFGNMLRAGLQQPPAGVEKDVKAPGEPENAEYQIQLEPPGPQRLFRLESEAALHERMRQEARERPAPERIEFPVEPTLGAPVTSLARSWPATYELAEPNYLCYRRLLFEDLNAERYGWDLGFIQPFLSATLFYWDFVMLPYNTFKEPCRCFECNAGYCLPGDPVPYMLYPPGFSISGLLAEAGAVVGLNFMFP
jgi:hypothetical protein